MSLWCYDLLFREGLLWKIKCRLWSSLNILGSPWEPWWFFFAFSNLLPPPTPSQVLQIIALFWQRRWSKSRQLSLQHCKNDPKRMYSNQCCVYILITHRHDLWLSCPSSHPRKILSVSVLYSPSQSILEDTAVLAPFLRWEKSSNEKSSNF